MVGAGDFTVLFHTRVQRTWVILGISHWVMPWDVLGFGVFFVNFKGCLDKAQEGRWIGSIPEGESPCSFPLSADGLTCILFGASAVVALGRWLPPLNCPPDQRVRDEGKHFWGWQ